MHRYELEDIVEALDILRDEVKLSEYTHGKPIDVYELAKKIEDVALQVVEADKDLGERIEDAEDEARNAMLYQETYLEQLQHAEDHIRWLEEEFCEHIVEMDMYERAC